MRASITALVAAFLLFPATAQASESTRAMHWFHTSGAKCVKSHEGAWTSNTGNGYYGGFQADRSFQRAYGKEFYYRHGPKHPTLAHHWPRLHQIVMAYRGWRARGWQPWPVSSRICGLR